MSISIKDVAKEAGVSISTVSKALNERSSISPETALKIKRVADEMGYVKTVASEKNMQRKSYTIGVAVAERYLEENKSFYWQLYQQAAQRALQKNCFTMLEVIGYSDERSQQIPKMVVEEKIDAIILMGSFKVEYAQLLSRNVRIPMVFFDTIGSDGN